MPIARCPHCQLPFLEEELKGGKCPTCTRPVHDMPQVEAAPKTRSTSFTLVLFAWLLGCGMTALAGYMVFRPDETMPTESPTPPPKQTVRTKVEPESRKLKELTAKLEETTKKLTEQEKQTGEAKDVAASLRGDITLLQTKMGEQQKLHTAALAELSARSSDPVKAKEAVLPKSGDVALLATRLAEQEKQHQASLALVRQELDKARLAWEAERGLMEAKLKTALEKAMSAPRTAPAKPAAITRPDFKKMEGEERAKTVRVDKADGTYVQKAMNRDEAIKLVGRARKLRLEALNGTAFLDTTGLVVEEIEIPGGIHGMARVRLRQENGKLNIGDITGSAVVDISGTHVRVVVRNVNGDPRIRVRSKRLEFHGAINGSPQIFATITSGGRLELRQLLGASHLAWNREHQGEPYPHIQVSEIAPGAVLQQTK